MTINGNLIKNIAIGVLVAFCAFSIIKFNSYNTILNDTVSINDYLQTENVKIKSSIDSLQLEYNKIGVQYGKMDSILDNRNRQLNKLKLENNVLQSTLADLENNMANISSDSSYTYLMHRYIPTQDLLPYGFAPNQVKTLHFNTLSLDQVELINTNITKRNTILTSNVNLLSSKYNLCVDQTAILIEQRSLLEREVSNINKINEGYIKTIKKQKFKTAAFGVGAAGILTYIVVQSITNK